MVLSTELLAQHGIRISDRTVARLLRDHGYSLQAANKTVEGAQHPDRNAQLICPSLAATLRQVSPARISAMRSRSSASTEIVT
jgi:hypothetical protein